MTAAADETAWFAQLQELKLKDVEALSPVSLKQLSQLFMESSKSAMAEGARQERARLQ
jgi:hypothetical protein